MVMFFMLEFLMLLIIISHCDQNVVLLYLLNCNYYVGGHFDNWSN
jgi:hypothetical protein